MLNETPYNDPVFNVTSMPLRAEPKDTIETTTKLSPRAKAGLALGAAAVVATGMVAVSQYESAQVKASVQKQQLALDAQRVTLAQEQQAAAAAQAASQETPVQKARRLAVEACVAKAGGSYGAINDCSNAYPASGSPALSNASSTTSVNSAVHSGSNIGLLALGGTGLVVVGGYFKRRFARS